MMAPAVILLLGWMLVPLVMTLWFSFRRFLPNRPGHCPRLGRLRQLCPLRHIEFVLAECSDDADHRRRRLADHHCVGRAPGAASGPADVGPGRCPYPGDRSVFRHANGVRPGLEEHLHGPGQRVVFPSLARLRCRSRGLAQRRTPFLHHPDRILAMAALCHADPADGDPVARQRAAWRHPRWTARRRCRVSSTSFCRI
jgi:ABC-type sugar transport system permease subunit